jgi:hypothetical protein
MRRRPAGVKCCLPISWSSCGREHHSKTFVTRAVVTTLLFHASLCQIGMSKQAKNAARNDRFHPPEIFLHRVRPPRPKPRKVLHLPRNFVGAGHANAILTITGAFLPKLDRIGNGRAPLSLRVALKSPRAAAGVLPGSLTSAYPPSCVVRLEKIHGEGGPRLGGREGQG